jgi:Resolvase, N terminal domain
MNRAVAYCRTACGTPRDRLSGLEDQRNAISQYATENDLTVVEMYMDVGVSGVSFPAEQARRLVKRFFWHYTPKHGSWLNMATASVQIQHGTLPVALLRVGAVARVFTRGARHLLWRRSYPPTLWQPSYRRLMRVRNRKPV